MLIMRERLKRRKSVTLGQIDCAKTTDEDNWGHTLYPRPRRAGTLDESQEVVSQFLVLLQFC